MIDVYYYVNNYKDAEAALYSYDTYIGVDLRFPDDNRNALYELFKKRVWNDDGQAIGVVNQNLWLDMSKYKVEYLDGYIDKMTTNQIDENMLSHIDPQCNQFLLLKDINDHCKDANKFNRADVFMMIKSGNVNSKKTTRYWTLQLEWKGG